MPGLARAEVRCARLAFDVDRYSSSLQTDDIVCTARENGFIVGTMTVRFDREQPLNADQIFCRRTQPMAPGRRQAVRVWLFGCGPPRA